MSKSVKFAEETLHHNNDDTQNKIDDEDEVCNYIL